MNVKFSLMVGTAIVCAAMTGCKAPKANVSDGSSVRPTPPPPPAKQAVVKDDVSTKNESKVDVAPVVKPEPARCKCAPGTTHDAPCKCGAADCGCKVVAPEPEYTLYRVKGGDTLSAICVTYGLKQKQVLELNPGLSPNKLYAGRKIKLPGVIEVKDDGAKPAAKPAAAKSAAKGKDSAPARASSYKGATKIYEVKSGDTLGKIAIDSGITVKCLKEMNGLNKNFIRIGQKLKVPAEKQVVAKKADVAKPAAGNAAASAAPAPVAKDKPAENASEKPAEEAKPETPAATENQIVAEPQAETVAAPVEPEPAAAPSASPKMHSVKEGEDAVSIAIQYQVSPGALLDLNNLKSADTLTPGQVLKLPDNAKVQ